MNKNILMMLGGGVLLYYFYTQKSGSTTSTGAPTSSTGATPTTTGGSTASSPAKPANSAARAAIVAAINSSGVSSTFIYGQQTPDTWNWYAMQAYPGWTAPDPQLLYPGEPNVHSKTYTFDDWFNRISGYLPGNAGMSGYQAPRSQYVGPGGWMA